MTQVTRDNHYVSQALLRRWAHDGHKLWAYRTLVPRQDVPEWAERSVRGTAYTRDLYTTFSGGAEVDNFEKWITRELEEPGLKAVDKAVGERSSRSKTGGGWRA